MALLPRQAIALELHRRLDAILAQGFSGRFISGPETTHPFIHKYTDGFATDFGAQLGNYIGNYGYLQDEVELADTIQTFHKHADGIEYSPDEIMVAAGSSALILGIMTFLRQHNVRSVHYFLPIYHTFYFLADLLDIALLPLCDKPLWENAAIPILPGGQQVLLFADPIWCAGRAVGDATIETVSRWQDRTGSTVIVDGTFQYLRWPGGRNKERSAELNRDHTIRLICPTKSLALHGIRFAYLLGPARILESIRWTCDHVTGSVSAFDMLSAEKVMRVLSSPEGNRSLIEHVRARYSELRAIGYIERTIVEPDCGYYVFGKVSRAEKADLFMDSRYFELTGPDDLVRINVLSPHIFV